MTSFTTAVQASPVLAIAGGSPVASKPFSRWPHFEQEDLEVAERVLRSGRVNYWTGEEGRQFEREFAAYVGCKHAVAIANGSVGLELALHALGLGPGDEVIVPSRTFVATATSVLMRGATPIFADIDRDSQNLTADTIAPLITARTKAIIPVHLAGWPCEMDPILDLAAAHKLKVIEDCAQTHGARYKDRPVGSMGDINSFSFCQDKIITTAGEGGMLTTNDDLLWELAWSFKDHGKSYDAVYRRQHPPGYRWVHESLGTNWRLTEVQSAIGRSQLRRLDQMVAMRRRHAAVLTDLFCGIPALRVPEVPADCFHSHYRLYAFVRPEALREGWDRDRIMCAINAEGIPCTTGSGACPEVYLEKVIPASMRPAERLPGAKEVGETCLAFLVHPTLTDDEIELTSESVHKVMAAASL
jgi:dTDP-4-amino-4,6-dideoxygalactose transaminase